MHIWVGCLHVCTLVGVFQVGSPLNMAICLWRLTTTRDNAIISQSGFLTCTFFFPLQALQARHSFLVTTVARVFLDRLLYITYAANSGSITWGSTRTRHAKWPHHHFFFFVTFSLVFFLLYSSLRSTFYCLFPMLSRYFFFISFSMLSMNAINIVVLNVSFLMFFMVCPLFTYLIFFISFIYFLFHFSFS
jgi:hypothetical protein